jgi:hypothetical protein
MAIKPPNFAKDAVPTKAGWRHPRTNEVLKAQNFTQDQIDEYLGEGKYAPPRRPRKPARPAFITEAPTTEEEFVAEHFEDEDAEVLEEEDR